MNRQLLLLPQLERFSDVGLLLLRMLTGGFLIYGVIDNIVSAERMQEFVAFMAANNFPAPELLAPFSVYLQFALGAALILGLVTRWAGIILALHFAVAIVMVHWQQDFRAWWPAIVLVAIGVHLALAGAGRFSVDSKLMRRSISNRSAQ